MEPEILRRCAEAPIGIPLPPSHSVATAAQYLANVVQSDLGTNNGKTALYWHLISVIHMHTEKPTATEE